MKKHARQRSRLGVARIRAASAQEAWFAWGWNHANDRWFQMDVSRRAAAGRLAELTGPAGVDHDRFWRGFGLTTTAHEIIQRLDNHQRCLLQAYSDGVNSRRSGVRSRSLTHRLTGTDAWAWSPADSALTLLRLYMAMAFDLDGRRTALVMRSTLGPELADFLMPGTDPFLHAESSHHVPSRALTEAFARSGRGSAALQQFIPVRPPGTAGSNCWTIDGSLALSGAPMLACDTHLPPSVPNAWHRIEIEVGAQVIAGVAIPGLPIVVVGSNGDLSWGVTNLPGDTLDLVAWADLERMGCERAVRDEVIAVHGSAPLTVQVEATPHGPVVPFPVLGEKCVARWSGAWSTASDFGFAQIAWCRDLDAGIDVAVRCGGPPLNVHFAHRDGRTARTLSGRVPIRREGELIRDLYLPSDRMPVVRGSQAPLVTANGPEQWDDRQLSLGWNHPSGYRTRRILDLVAARSAWTEADMGTVQQDTAAGYLDFYREVLLAAIPPEDGGLSARMRRALEAWDGTCSPGAIGAALLDAFRTALLHALLQPLLAPCMAADPGFRFGWRNPEAAIRAWVSAREPLPPQTEGCTTWEDFLCALASCVADALERRHGVPIDDLQWRRVAETTIPPIASVGPTWRRFYAVTPLPPQGAAESVSVLSAGAAPAQRMIVTPGAEERGLFAMPGGQSESPFSTHYRDHHRHWFAGTYSELLSPSLLA